MTLERPDDARLTAPHVARNRDAIRAVFLEHMPRSGQVLEIASGTGEHAIHLAAALPGVRWLPGDPDPHARRSIRAWIEFSGLSNLADPHATDAAAESWPVAEHAPFSAIVAINMVHIAPFEAAIGLMRGAGRWLGPDGRLYLYGPFRRAGRHTAPSNTEFDANLRARDPRWGVRDLEDDLLPLAAEVGLELHTVVNMPANNLSVIFRKA
ncbi:MAG: DUF938 domain-containing protein [Pseudomonadales bacterium]|nr:DUF938 domain-containing protein [Pseudomonadales bacterium]